MAKRFYKAVSVTALDGGFAVYLDGRELKTPGRQPIRVVQPLAEAMAAEWDAQVHKIRPETMPVTRLVNVATERTPDNRADILAELRRYAGTDLVCYRAPEPRSLRERQDAGWDIWRDWAAERGVDLAITDSLIAIPQMDTSLSAVEDFGAKLDDISLTLFMHLTAVYGSVVLAMAVMSGALAPHAGFDLSRIDADHQIELWGEDEEQAEITAALRVETATLGALAQHVSPVYTAAMTAPAQIP